MKHLKIFSKGVLRLGALSLIGVLTWVMIEYFPVALLVITGIVLCYLVGNFPPDGDENCYKK